MNQTDGILASMLTENTGRHFLDSGGAYGRHWERNQGRDFESEPATTLDFKYGIEVTHNAYHWLSERVDYDPEMDRRFEEFSEDPANADKSWLELMDEFPEWLCQQGHEIGGIYAEGSPVTVNTYNDQDLLSQVLQYVYFTVDGIPCVLLQIHGGCDVRGGYTKPRVFTESGYGELAIMDNARASIVCRGKPCENGDSHIPGIQTCCGDRHNWSTDDGYHWYKDGTCAPGYINLEDYETTENPASRGKGKLFVDEDGNGYCPICGALLEGF